MLRINGSYAHGCRAVGTPPVEAYTNIDRDEIAITNDPRARHAVDKFLVHADAGGRRIGRSIARSPAIGDEECLPPTIANDLMRCRVHIARRRAGNASSLRSDERQRCQTASSAEKFDLGWGTQLDARNL